MKHSQNASHPSRPERPIYYVHHQRLANPLPEVISVAVLAMILVVAHYMH